MKSIILIILTTIACNVMGQTHFIGIKGGANFTNVQTIKFLNDNEKRIGFSGGLTYEYLFSRHFSISADLIYDQRGFINYLIFTDSLGNPTGRKEPTYFYYDYFSIPIMMGFMIGDKIYGFAKLGLCPSLPIYATTKNSLFDSGGNIVGAQTYNVTDRITKLDLASVIQLGVGYKIKDKVAMITSVSFLKSFTNIANSNYFKDSSIKHYGISVSAGLIYSLN